MAPADFNEHTTAEQAASHFASVIKGKNVIVTGCTLGGLGAETARVIAKYGAALVVLAGRSLSKLEECEASIKKETPGANLRNLVLDLNSLKSVREAAKEVLSYSENIDVLINNAAIMAAPYSRTEDGFEAQFGTNHLGPFLFTNLIKSKILSSPSPRIVNVSSFGHRRSDIRWDDPGFEEGKVYDEWHAYGQSKTANMLFAVGLSNRWGVQSFSLHPGAIWTNLARHMTKEDKVRMGFIDEDGNVPKDSKYVWKNLQAGASTQVTAAFDPEIAGQSGSYLVDTHVANEIAQPYALNKESAEKLWKLSEKMVGETFA
ncbi:short-chain dehydrogenase [Meredithblackwellia eburnea MCA 4105]